MNSLKLVSLKTSMVITEDVSESKVVLPSEKTENRGTERLLFTEGKEESPHG